MITVAELTSRVKALRAGRKAGQIGCGRGVVLAIKASGTAAYYLRTRQAGKGQLIRLGTYEELTLAGARGLAVGIRDGSPVVQDITTIAEPWLQLKAGQVAPPTLSHLRSQVAHLTAALAGVAMADLMPLDVVAALRRRGLTEQRVKRVVHTLKAMLDWAVGAALIDGHRCGQIAMLTVAPKSDGLAWVPASQLRAAFFEPLEGTRELQRCYYLMVALTGLRPGVARALEWGWVHADHIAVPADAMKMRRPFKVPVTSHVASLLDKLRRSRVKGSPYLFSLTGKRAIDAHYINDPVASLCPDMHLHGLRKSLSTWLGEQVDDSGMPRWPHEIRELCLAHVVGSAVARIYDHGDYLAPRGQIMQAWGDYLTSEALTAPWLELLAMPVLRVVR